MRSDTMTATTDQYLMQFYQQQPGPMVPSKEGFSDAPSTQLNTPKGHNNNNNVPKPIRRRSRASKKTPTTLLNANTTNFRALVQQFTGCPSTTMSSLGVHKGPITLNFKNGSSKQKNQPNTTTRIMQQNCTTSDVNQVAAAAVQFPLLDQQVQHQQQLFQEQHGGGYSFDYMKSNNFLPALGNSSDLTSFSDLTSVNAFSNDTY
ncbi:unnamed protein product [Lupinus luteus]|uniref:VQ domain-containing protein n=1 Tax=Lupinus luteus TaxID=3873 RepID=A0AAV1VXM2_LUPLU